MVERGDPLPQHIEYVFDHLPSPCFGSAQLGLAFCNGYRSLSMSGMEEERRKSCTGAFSIAFDVHDCDKNDGYPPEVTLPSSTPRVI